MVGADYRPQWPVEFESLAGTLRAALGGLVIGIDHEGSTSVPGLPAKDCIDVQVRMRSVDEQGPCHGGPDGRGRAMGC
ncbi:hypothetical protein EAO72_25825 [Streptomyces sp. or43]|nr:hypothetical protein EAO72_25825 [Streptomyces sp. or43]